MMINKNAQNRVMYSELIIVKYSQEKRQVNSKPIKDF